MELICSIGPTVRDIEDIKRFAQAGMTIPRFNFSHIDYEKFETLIKEIHIEYPNMKILQDLQGNKLRISKLFTGEYKVNIKEEVIFCLEKDFKKFYEKNRYKNIRIIPIMYYGSLDDFKNVKELFMKDATMKFKIIEKNSLYIKAVTIKNIRIIPIMYYGSLDDFKNVKELFMKDATMKFKIIEKNSLYIKAVTIKGGILRAEKGVNAPELIRDNLHLTEKDKFDIEIGVKNNIDYICLSYVTKADDILELKKYIKNLVKLYNSRTPKIWAKIECKEGIENFEDILKVSDGIMLGRGDLKAEIPIEEIPYEEGKIINRMKKSKKKLIVATYILESMRRQDTPTISEANDIYKYIKNSVDGLMLSTEVTVSREPITVIKCLSSFYNKYCN